MKPGNLEVQCARMEQMLMDEIGAALARAMERRSFPRMAVSGDIAGAYETTIKERSMTWVLTGCTTLGNPIRMAFEIAHDESWVPVVTVSSTETEEPQYIVAGRDVREAAAEVVGLVDRIIGFASARSKYEREHLAELLQGKTEFTIYE